MSPTGIVHIYLPQLESALQKVLLELNVSEIANKKIAFEHPNDESHGDYSTNIAFQLSKELKKSPLAIAEMIQQVLPEMDFISDVTVAAPGFINFFFTPEVLASELSVIDTKKDAYGKNDWGKGKKWLLEHTSPNPNKAMHIGHLRNNVTAMAIGNIWEFSGAELIRDCIDNNRGIAIAKLMWGFLKFAHKTSEDHTDILYWYDHQHEWHTPESINMPPDKFVDMLYVKGESDFSAYEESSKNVRQIVVDWETHDEKVWALWKLVLNYSYEGQALTLERLQNKWDKVWHEHEHYREGKDFVERGIQKGVFQVLEDGAVLTDLEEKYDLSNTIIRKSDGTSLYITQDLALTELKHNTFHVDKMFWVIGPEQALAMKQMFAVCDQLGIGNYDDFVHLSYGRMSIKGQGKMSSRLGNVVYIDDLIDTAKEAVMEKMDTSRFSEEEIEDIGEKVAVGAIKYSILKVGRTVNMEFDMETSIAYEGNSGAYLMYTLVRAKSILRRAEASPDFSHISTAELEGEELALLRWIYQFEEAIREAAENFSPNLICNFLYELAKKFNSLYNAHSILNEKDEKKKNFRLALVSAVSQILENGFHTLNIEAPERM